MAYIQTIGPRQSRGNLLAIYEQLRLDMVGTRFLPLTLSAWGIMRVFSLRPAMLRAFCRSFLHTMWGGPLRRAVKEALGVTVAQVNSCPY
jgi:hypothetical protein